MQKPMRQTILQEPSVVCENTSEKRRQQLADLIGKLLARHWLKKQSQKQPMQSAPGLGKAK